MDVCKIKFTWNPGPCYNNSHGYVPRAKRLTKRWSYMQSPSCQLHHVGMILIVPSQLFQNQSVQWWQTRGPHQNSWMLYLTCLIEGTARVFFSKNIKSSTMVLCSFLAFHVWPDQAFDDWLFNFKLGFFNKSDPHSVAAFSYLSEICGLKIILWIRPALVLRSSKDSNVIKPVFVPPKPRQSCLSLCCPGLPTLARHRVSQPVSPLCSPGSATVSRTNLADSRTRRDFPESSSWTNFRVFSTAVLDSTWPRTSFRVCRKRYLWLQKASWKFNVDQHLYLRIAFVKLLSAVSFPTGIWTTFCILLHATLNLAYLRAFDCNCQPSSRMSFNLELPLDDIITLAFYTDVHPLGCLGNADHPTKYRLAR